MCARPVDKDPADDSEDDSDFSPDDSDTTHICIPSAVFILILSNFDIQINAFNATFDCLWIVCVDEYVWISG